MAVKGSKQLKKSLKELAEKYPEHLDDALFDMASETSLEAQKNAPTNFGQLRNSIDVFKVSFLEYKVVASAYYATFVEFGTKTRTSIPSELKAYASSFKNKGGDFKKLLASIEKWCNGKGINPKAAYPIALKIARLGIEAQPFFFPAYNKAKSKLFKNIIKLVK